MGHFDGKKQLVQCTKIRGRSLGTSPPQSNQQVAEKWDTESFYGIIRLFVAGVPPVYVRFTSPPLRVGGNQSVQTRTHAPIRRLQQPRHFTRKAFRLRHRREARSHDANLINQELREVPFYAVAQQAALLLPKPNVEGVGVLAVDLDLGERMGRQGFQSRGAGTVRRGSASHCTVV